jgi:hypothetical protein
VYPRANSRHGHRQTSGSAGTAPLGLGPSIDGGRRVSAPATAGSGLRPSPGGPP